MGAVNELGQCRVTRNRTNDIAIAPTAAVHRTVRRCAALPAAQLARQAVVVWVHQVAAH
jgi:hypothetical protein